MRFGPFLLSYAPRFLCGKVLGGRNKEAVGCAGIFGNIHISTQSS